MSASEVIEMIKKLPPEEQAKVLAFSDELRAQAPGPASPRYAAQERAMAVARGVFDRHPELFRKLAQ